MRYWIIISIITLVIFSLSTNAQQNYSGNAVLVCNGSSNTNPSESFLYTCNGKYSTCKAFLIFTSKFPYNTVPSIAAQMSSDQAEIARLNNITRFTIFPTEQEVIVPIDCSCSGRYYRSVANFEIPNAHETYLTLANNTYQGLSTCGALRGANDYSWPELRPGQKLRIPLRCACPTSGQVAMGTEYLMTYSIGLGDTLYSVGERFNVSLTSIKEANGFSDEYTSIYPFTTILIPLPSQPISSQTITRGYKPSTSLPLAPIAPQKKRSKRVLFTTIIATSTFSLLFVVVVALLLFLKKKARIRENKGKNSNITSPEELFIEIARIERALKIFRFSEIKKATGNFRSKNRIKEYVYRGTFGKEVLAVKMIKGYAQNVVNILHQINHSNIVKLLGYCEHEDDSYLVYEYMKNGSLQEWLTQRGSKDWKKRIQIALDVANGLLYLHYYTKPGYVHNDVRSSNILLDDNLRAKISNFSLARTANDEISPITVKNDVFAFGMVLLELITSKYTDCAHEGSEKLVSIIMGSQNAEAELRTFMEPGLAENGGVGFEIQLMKLSSSCLLKDPADRPNMVEIVSVLLKLQYHLNKAVAVEIP